MSLQLYNPFENIYLEKDTCFLTGDDLTSEEETVPVFPGWVLDRFGLRNSRFRMMDKINTVEYGSLKLPGSKKVLKAFSQLEEDVQAAFGRGYEGVLQLPDEKLFLWMGKMLYGILYHDLLLERKRLERKGQALAISPRLKEKYGLFHLMLQSIVSPVSFNGVLPWSISVVRLKYSKDIFHYRDNPVHLVFSLGMNGFGIIACLQDNGMVKQSQMKLLEKIGDAELHPVQFEELCAKFLYAHYLLQYKPVYKMEEKDDELMIQGMKVDADIDKPLFAPWDDTTYAQLLAGYWEAWGFTSNDIVRHPDGVVSFLENDLTNELIDPLSITLPF